MRCDCVSTMNFTVNADKTNKAYIANWTIYFNSKVHCTHTTTALFNL